MYELTVEQRAELERLERVIEEGLESFRRVGHALLCIKEQRLFRERYDTFEEYCKDQWDMSQSMGYYLMQASSVADALEGSDTLPSRSSHAAPLYILHKFDDAEQVQREAWADALASPERLSGQLVETMAHKHYVLATGGFLAQALNLGWLAPGDAYHLLKVLERLPEYYAEAVYRFGVTERGIVSNLALLEIRSLEYAFPDEARDILRSGVLDNGRDEIGLYDLEHRDVEAYRRKLYYEQGQQRRIEVGRKQTAAVQQSNQSVVIADGFDIYERVESYAQGRAMFYLFPEEEMTPQQLAALLEKQRCRILFVAAYTPDEPDFNFDGFPVSPSRINGVKPQLLLKMIQNSVIG